MLLDFLYKFVVTAFVWFFLLFGLLFGLFNIFILDAPEHFLPEGEASKAESIELLEWCVEWLSHRAEWCRVVVAWLAKR